MSGSREHPRDRAVAEVTVGVLAERDVRGPVLVVDDETGAVEAHLEARGVSWRRWRRIRSGGIAPSPWPPEGPYAAATLRLPKGRDALEVVLTAIAGALAPEGTLWIVGANDEGARSIGPRVAGVFDDVEPVDARRHCRAYRAGSPKPSARRTLEDWATACEAELPDGPLTWVSFPGVFAHGRLDDGTRRLLAAVPVPRLGARVLDFACGVGLIGMVLARRAGQLHLELLDVDALALEAARRNVPGAEVYASDGWERVGDARFDLIVSNPPLHAGVGTELGILHDLVARAPEHLSSGGELWLVTLSTVPLQGPLEQRFREVALAAEGGGYRVWRAGRPR